MDIHRSQSWRGQTLKLMGVVGRYYVQKETNGNPGRVLKGRTGKVRPRLRSNRIYWRAPEDASKKGKDADDDVCWQKEKRKWSVEYHRSSWCWTVGVRCREEKQCREFNWVAQTKLAGRRRRIWARFSMWSRGRIRYVFGWRARFKWI